MRGAPEPRAGARVARLVMPPSWAVLTLAIMPFVVGLEPSPVVVYAPFALSLVLLGLPHGAVDHLVPGWLSGGGPSRRSVLAVALLYLALGLPVVALWFAAPALAFTLFVLLTLFHWGSGDVYTLKALAGARHVRGAALPLAVLVRGALPMLVPLLFFPEVYRSVAEGAVGLFGEGAVPEALFGTDFRIAAGGASLAVALLYLVLGYRRAGETGRRAWRVDAGEVVLLAAYFSVVPPVLAVGLYFCLWHSARHLGRLALLDGRAAAWLARGRPGRALWTVLRAATPLTVVALALLVALYAAAPNAATGPASLLGVYLVLLSALTLPHAVVVGYADAREGTFRCAVQDRGAEGR